MTPYLAAFAAALFAAQRFFVAATIAALPSALSTRFFFAGSAAFAGVAEPAFFSAHRFLWAAAIALRPAALIRLLLGAVGVTGALPLFRPRSSAICASIRRFWASNPSIAASMISCVSFGGIGNHSDIIQGGEPKFAGKGLARVGGCVLTRPHGLSCRGDCGAMDRG